MNFIGTIIFKEALTSFRIDPRRKIPTSMRDELLGSGARVAESAEVDPKACNIKGAPAYIVRPIHGTVFMLRRRERNDNRERGEGSEAGDVPQTADEGANER